MPESFIDISKEFISSITGDPRWRLRVWIQATSNNIPGTLFVYQRFPGIPGINNGESFDRFVHIASYADMISFPEDSPGIDNPFFRKYYLDIVHNSRSFLEEKWEMMGSQLQTLIADITRINNLPPGQLRLVSDDGGCITWS